MNEQSKREIRASMLDSWNDCELRAAVQQWPDHFKTQDVRVGANRTTASRAIGTAAHAAVARMLQPKINGDSLGDIDESIDYAKELFAKETRSGFLTDAITRTPGEATDQIARIARTFGGLVGYKIKPQFVEQQFSHVWDNRWNVTGKIDYNDTSGKLPDLKTGRADRVYLGQVGLYSLSLRSDGYSVTDAGVLRIRRTGRTETPAAPEFIWYDRLNAERYAHATISRITTAMNRVFEMGRYYDPLAHWALKMNPSSYCCSEKYCPAWGFCPAAKAKGVSK